MMTNTLTLSRPFDGLKLTARQWQERARTLARGHPRGAIGLGVLGFVSAVAVGSLAVPNPSGTAAQAAPPAPPPLILQNVAPQQALKVNSEIPLANGPNPAAAAF